MGQLNKRLDKLEQFQRAPERLAQECRERTLAIVDGLSEPRAIEGLTAEELMFAPELLDDEYKQWNDAERIALHDRVRVAFGLTPIGELP